MTLGPHNEVTIEQNSNDMITFDIVYNTIYDGYDELMRVIMINDSYLSSPYQLHESSSGPTHSASSSAPTDPTTRSQLQ